MQKVKITLIAILVVLVLIIIFQNMKTTTTQLLFFSIEMPLAVLLFLTALIGFFIGFLIAGRKYFRK